MTVHFDQISKISCYNNFFSLKIDSHCKNVYLRDIIKIEAYGIPFIYLEEDILTLLIELENKSRYEIIESTKGWETLIKRLKKSFPEFKEQFNFPNDKIKKTVLYRKTEM
ncbi:hypothetical protein H3Z83_12620 [Tenacibaculum sp. S7007]|uniref:Uncharacterized protein n=1 Tax=Tenacibaculum pelagium TaxID=2759527 RepID=A0A839AQI4_9FLAO|nr:hypothetical protein [Tenacibaculum pelagium]MBA6157353.1 hypothetical protein [Tenacibaculum pelagium]